MTPAKDEYNSLLCLICDLIGAVTGKRAFSTTDHIQAVKEEWWDGVKDQDLANDTKLWEILSSQGAFDRRLFLRTKHMFS